MISEANLFIDFIILITMFGHDDSEREEAMMKKMIDEYIPTKELYLNKQGININLMKYLCSRKTEEITMILLGKL